jgi:hypothetical protein
MDRLAEGRFTPQPLDAKSRICLTASASTIGTSAVWVATAAASPIISI